VRAAKVERISVQRQVEMSGTLLSLDQAKVSSEAAGVVQSVPIQIGTEVRPGTVLVQLDSREKQYALDSAESALRQTEAQLGMAPGQSKPPADEDIASVRSAAATRDDARAAFERASRLMARGLLASADMETTTSRLKVAEASYQQVFDSARALKAGLMDRRASYELAKKKLADTSIRAPVAGIVAERLVQPGEFIQTNTPVAVVVQIHPLKLRTALQERYAGLITQKLPVEFRVASFPSEIFRGEIAHVSPSVDQATRTFVVEALVDNTDQRLKPGFFAKGVLTTKLDSNVPAVTEDAVATLAGVSSVYVIENNTIRQQQVSLGVKQGKLVEIVDGLKGDETMAASGLSNLATGTPVRIGTGESAPGPGGGLRGEGSGRRGDGSGRRGQGGGPRGGQQ
jgi:RND family efflux transporter MFP subunit